MEGVREEVPVLLLQILDGELVMLEGLPNDKIRCEHKPLRSPSLFLLLLYQVETDTARSLCTILVCVECLVHSSTTRTHIAPFPRRPLAEVGQRPGSCFFFLTTCVMW